MATTTDGKPSMKNVNHKPLDPTRGRAVWHLRVPKGNPPVLAGFEWSTTADDLLHVRVWKYQRRWAPIVAPDYWRAVAHFDGRNLRWQHWTFTVAGEAPPTEAILEVIAVKLFGAPTRGCVTDRNNRDPYGERCRASDLYFDWERFCWRAWH